MICPSCGLLLRIGRADATVEDGRPVMVHEMVCANPGCAFCRAGAPVKRVVHDLMAKQPEGDEGVTMCCNTLLCKITAEGYFASPLAKSEAAGDRLRVVCPVCGSGHVFDIANTKPLAAAQ